MISRLNIPLHFHADGPLKAELERLATELDAYVRGLAVQYALRPAVSSVLVADGALAFDTLNRVLPQTEASLITLQLPRADSRNAGRAVRVLRLARTGRIRVLPVDCAVNNATSLGLATAVGVTTIWFDGSHYYSSLPYQGWWSGEP